MTIMIISDVSTYIDSIFHWIWIDRALMRPSILEPCLSWLMTQIIALANVTNFILLLFKVRAKTGALKRSVVSSVLF